MKVPKKVSTLLRKHLYGGSKERASIKAKKEYLMKSLSEKAFHEIGDDKSENEIERQLKKVLRESREIAWRDTRLYKRCWWQ